VLGLSQNAQGSFQNSYVSIQDYFKAMRGWFGANCIGRIICGAGQDNCNHLKNMFEFRNIDFIKINQFFIKK